MNKTSLSALKNSNAYADLLNSAKDLKPLNLKDDSDFVYEEMRIAFAEFFLSEMKKKGMTQAELANKLGKKKQYVSRILSNKGNITLLTIAQFCAAMGLSSQRILPGIFTNPATLIKFEAYSNPIGFGGIKKDDLLVS